MYKSVTSVTVSQNVSKSFVERLQDNDESSGFGNDVPDGLYGLKCNQDFM